MKREIINESDLQKVVGGVDYTVKQEPDEDYPERGMGYIYADGKLEFSFSYYDQKDFDATVTMYFSTVVNGDPEAGQRVDPM